MPQFTTELYDDQNESRVNTSRLAVQVMPDEILYKIVRYTTTTGTDEAAADTILLCELPAGCIPIPHLSSIVCAADPGTALTLDIGTAANPDGWGDAVALTVLGMVPFCLAGGTMPAWLTPTPLVADTGSGNATVYATVDTATSPDPGVNIDFVLAYKKGA
jgi:hypothetical protein